MRSLIAVLFLAVLSFSAPVLADVSSTTGAAEVTSALVGQAREVPLSRVVETPPPASGEIDIGNVVKLVVDALNSRNWGLLACAGVLAAVYLTRRFGGVLWPWLRSDVGGVVLSYVTAVLLALTSALSTGTSLSLSLLIGALLTAAGASGFWAWGKKLLPKPTAAKH